MALLGVFYGCLIGFFWVSYRFSKSFLWTLCGISMVSTKNKQPNPCFVKPLVIEGMAFCPGKRPFSDLCSLEGLLNILKQILSVSCVR